MNKPLLKEKLIKLGYVSLERSVYIPDLQLSINDFFLSNKNTLIKHLAELSFNQKIERNRKIKIARFLSSLLICID